MRLENLSTVRKYKEDDESAIARFFNKLTDCLKPPKWYIYEEQMDQNRSREEYIHLICHLILNAKKSVHIVCEESCLAFWSNDSIVSALKNSKAKEIVAVICGSTPHLEQPDVERLAATNKNIKIFHTYDRTENHFLSTDNAILIEADHTDERHARIAVFCLGSAIINEVYKNKIYELRMKEKIYS